MLTSSRVKKGTPSHYQLSSEPGVEAAAPTSAPQKSRVSLTKTALVVTLEFMVSAQVKPAAAQSPSQWSNTLITLPTVPEAIGVSWTAVPGANSIVHAV